MIIIQYTKIINMILNTRFEEIAMFDSRLRKNHFFAFSIFKK